jgi:hypothetical protein
MSISKPWSVVSRCGEGRLRVKLPLLLLLLLLLVLAAADWGGAF